MRVLLAGFEPFGGLRRNPTADVVRRLARDGHTRRAGVATTVLPVHRRRAPEALERALSRHQPETLLLTGVALGRTRVEVERLGVNCYRGASSRGAGRRIRKNGPDGLFSTLPLAAVVTELRRAGLRAGISESAGTYTCNLVLYLALCWAREGLPSGRRPPKGVAFLHVPPTDESLDESRRATGAPTVELDLLVEGLGSLARSVISWRTGALLDQDSSLT